MKYKAVIFDLDDTLLDSFDARAQILQQVFTRAGISHPTAGMFLKSLRGVALREALSQHKTTREIAENLYDDYRRAYWSKKPGLVRLYPGVWSMLKRLCTHSLKLGVVTQKGREFELDGNRVGAIKELEEVGILDMFSVIVGFEDVSWTKPHPQGISIALGQLMVPPDKTLVVGDSDADIMAAQAAQCRSCYATWGLPHEDKLKDIQANLVADTPETLCRLVLQRYNG